MYKIIRSDAGDIDVYTVLERDKALEINKLILHESLKAIVDAMRNEPEIHTTCTSITVIGDIYRYETVGIFDLEELKQLDETHPELFI